MSFTDAQKAAITKAVKGGYLGTDRDVLGLLEKDVGWLDCSEFTGAVLEASYGRGSRSLGNSFGESERIRKEARETIARITDKYL